MARELRWSVVLAMVLHASAFRTLHPSSFHLRPLAAAGRLVAPVAFYNDDAWLASSACQPLSSESLDVLFKYGPVVYGSRCFDSEEYDASVRKLMGRYPKISRELAEQEIHEFLSDANGYLARTTAKGYKGPQPSDLKPPVGLADRLLVIAWVLILVPVVSTLVTLSYTASYTEPANQLSSLTSPATNALLNNIPTELLGR